MQPILWSLDPLVAHSPLRRSLMERKPSRSSSFYLLPLMSLRNFGPMGRLPNHNVLISLSIAFRWWIMITRHSAFRLDCNFERKSTLDEFMRTYVYSKCFINIADIFYLIDKHKWDTIRITKQPDHIHWNYPDTLRYVSHTNTHIHTYVAKAIARL